MSDIHRILLQEVYDKEYSFSYSCGSKSCSKNRLRGKIQVALNIPKDIAQARFNGYSILRVKSSGQKAYALTLKQAESPYRKKGYLTIYLENGLAYERKISNLIIETGRYPGLSTEYKYTDLAAYLEAEENARNST